MERLTRGQHTGHEESRVDRRHFAPPLAGPAAPVDEVIEPAALVRQVCRRELQCRPDARHRVVLGQPAARRGHGQGRQAEAGCGDARDVVLGMD